MVLIRIILIITLGFLIGIIYGLCFEKSIALFIVFLLLIYSIIYKKIKLKKTKIILFILIISAVISNIYILQLNNKYKNVYKNSNSNFDFYGIVLEGPKENNYTYSYIVKAKNSEYKNKKFIIYVSKKSNNLFVYGDLIKIDGIYKSPSLARNYKGFDYSKYLKTKKIYGIINVEKIELIKQKKLNSFLILINNIRVGILNKIDILIEPKIKDLLASLLIGQTENLPKEITDNFKKSGLSHVLAVSGMHISYLIIGVTFLLNKNSKKTRQIISILVIIIFTFITNFRPSVIRAAIMGIIAIGAKLFYRKLDILNSISLSLLVILIYNPHNINDIGVQLSYLGTLGIILFNEKIYSFLLNKIKYKNLINYYKTKKILFNLIKSILKIFSISISAQILIMPIIAIQFNNICLNFWLSSIITSPIIATIILLGFFTICLSFIFNPKVLVIFLNSLLKFLILITNIISNIPFSNILIKTPKTSYIFFYYGLIFYIIYRKKIKINYKKLLVILIVLMLIINLTNIKEIIFPNLKIYFIDVGQGDSSLIITPKNKTILIDGGEAEDTVFSYLLDRQVTKIDYLVISHFDNDHCNGLVKVIEELKVKKIIISNQTKISDEYLNIINIAKAKNIIVVKVKRGDKINIEKNVYIDIIYPNKELEYKDLNNNSIVARLVYCDFSVLFTGDIEEAEKEILDSNLKSIVLKVSHHGSKSSTSQEFLKKVNPKIALIGVGENNKFGHPSNITLENLNNIDCKIYRTDENGEISIRVNGKGKIWIDKMID